MIKYGDLRGSRRRRHRRFLAKIQRSAVVYVRHEAEFRMAARLHRAGLVSACASKWNWTGEGRRAFRELAMYARESEARAQYDWLLPRGFGRW